ncbi:MAG TPA: NrsF family protein [Rhizomicrobium sp.]|jgi:hypothetical protein|nr:NrsF family protein [Rhizomicrobium sp.]
MRTDRLIDTLASDRMPGMQPTRMIAIAALAGIAVTGALFFATLGPRPDFMAAMGTWRFVMKFVVTIALAASTALLVARAARPETRRGPADALLYLAPIVLLLAVIVELFVVPQASWMPRLIGHNARICMMAIPFFSLGPLALLLLALREGATANPLRAGALAGLMAGGLGAAFYAAHCPDDSPLFVAVWYTLAIALVTGLGALAGRRLLRW